jgi:hypothetical protein
MSIVTASTTGMFSTRQRENQRRVLRLRRALGIAVHGIGMSHLAFFEQLGESSWSTISASPTVASGRLRILPLFPAQTVRV